MIQARDNRAPIPVFQDLFNNAPSVSLGALYDLTVSLFLHIHVVRLLVLDDERAKGCTMQASGSRGLILLHRSVFSIAFLFGTRQYECIRGFRFGYD
jgi:hypothetical protein